MKEKVRNDWLTLIAIFIVLINHEKMTSPLELTSVCKLKYVWILDRSVTSNDLGRMRFLAATLFKCLRRHYGNVKIVTNMDEKLWWWWWWWWHMTYLFCDINSFGTDEKASDITLTFLIPMRHTHLVYTPMIFLWGLCFWFSCEICAFDVLVHQHIQWSTCI